MATASTTTVRPTMACPIPTARATARHRFRRACSIRQARSLRRARSTQRGRSIRRCKTPCAYTPFVLMNPHIEDRSMASYSLGVSSGLLRKTSSRRWAMCVVHLLAGHTDPRQ